MFVLVSANLINWLFNWLFIFGHWGFPRLGVVGSALSTCLARAYMALALLFFIWWFERGNEKGILSIVRPPDPHALVPLAVAGFAGGHTNSHGNWRIRRGSGISGTPVARRVGRAPNRHQLRFGHLHGAAGRFVRRRRSGGPSHRPR